MRESEYFVVQHMDAATSNYDLAIAWTWKYDLEFVQALETASTNASLRILLIDARSVEDVYERVRSRMLYFRIFLDRASDEDETFQPLARLIHKRLQEPEHFPTIRPINPLDLVSKASDKATMHLEFLTRGINVPYTIIISPYNHKKEIELTLTELAKLGRPFIIKPANTTGGGIGVVTGAETLKDVIEARQHHRNDKYLLQETIKPATLGARRGWFRVFYAFGEVLPCWWDDQTHIYSALDAGDEVALGLQGLRSVTNKIHEVCKLDFFSTELVFTPGQGVVAVDYVNEMCDMRLQSIHPDGVPDSVAVRIVQSLLNFINTN